MLTFKQVSIPVLVRVKSGALDRVGLYARRQQFTRVVLLFSQDLQPALLARLTDGLAAEQIEVLQQLPVAAASFEQAVEIFRQLPTTTHSVIGVGGGKALDVAKYVAFLAHLPYFAVPTSLSNDGFCSPQSSLTVDNRRRSLPAAIPFGVILDTEVCLRAPEILWLSGVGDLAAKLTAVADWKLAFHAQGTPVDDFAALLSDATVFQFIARPVRDAEGVKLLGSALMLNGIAMALCGSSRPASGSEHLISHALDALSAHPRLHGLQVGVATYLVSCLQAQNTERIAGLFDATGFWRAIAADPFSRSEWIEAARIAPTVKPGFYTVLSARDCRAEIECLLAMDPHLQACFV
jgi:glycerol-1-phosphate dehydrogenase [NAD(P)+]